MSLPFISVLVVFGHRGCSRPLTSRSFSQTHSKENMASMAGPKRIYGGTCFSETGMGGWYSVKTERCFVSRVAP